MLLLFFGIGLAELLVMAILLGIPVTIAAVILVVIVANRRPPEE